MTGDEGRPDTDTRERTEGPTPHGGAYAVAFWRDAKGDPCPKAEATEAEIVEYDAAGNQVFRTYMGRPAEADR